MTPHSRALCLGVVLAASVGLAPSVARAQVTSTPSTPKAPTAEFRGLVEDEHGRPLPGAVVSALGDAQVFAVSDEAGRFLFPALAPGSYVVRAHRHGYLPAKTRIVHLQAGNQSVSRLTLTGKGEQAPPEVLTAGLGMPGGEGADPPTSATDAHGHDALAWRLRRARRSVLKDVETTLARFEQPDGPEAGTFAGLTRALGDSARYASGWFSELTLDGELNLLTTTLFERPQDLLSMGGNVPRGVAYLSVTTPGPSGAWSLRGTVTQGDLPSWMLAGAYERQVPGSHRYEAGLSYSMQRYLGGNTEALAAIPDGDRNAGAVYAFDTWTLNPKLQIEYGARYERYDYLPEPGLLSPRAAVAVKPWADDSLTIRLSAAHRGTAPGAREFLPSSVGVSLPPSRTFSSLSREPFRAQRTDHFEVTAEREWRGGVLLGVRAFQQHVLDQGVTLFGAEMPQPSGEVGHYFVGSAGDVTAVGWGLSAAADVTDALRASVAYTQFDADWSSRDTAMLALLARSAMRGDERVRDLTARLEGELPVTSTRLLVLYKVSNGFSARRGEAAGGALDARFDVQVNQALPFLKLTGTRWEMLAAVSNVFGDHAFDGSVYDELLVVRPPMRMLGGVSVRF